MNFSQQQQRLRDEIRRRIERGVLTRTLLARRIGVNIAHISNFVAGKRSLSIAALDRVLQALDLDVHELDPRSTSRRQGLAGSGVDAAHALVPVVSEAKAIFDARIAPRSISEFVSVRSDLLQRQRVRCAVLRRNWERFVAVRLSGDESEFIKQVVSRGSIFVIDRHYTSSIPYSSDGRTLYAVALRSAVHIRYIQVVGESVLLRPLHNAETLEPMKTMSSRTLASSPTIVGRIILALTEY